MQKCILDAIHLFEAAARFAELHNDRDLAANCVNHVEYMYVGEHDMSIRRHKEMI